MAGSASIEVLVTGTESVFGAALLTAWIDALTPLVGQVRVTDHYRGRDSWLSFYGGGERSRMAARTRQLKRGGDVAFWDLGYFGRTEDPASSYGRLALNDDHPWRYMDATPNDPARWRAHGIALREDYAADGPVIVVGMGKKSRVQLGMWDWEDKKILEMKLRYPRRKVLYRPKRYELRRNVENVPAVPIEQAIKGASLVVCRHSNVAVDACIAGIPVECDDGIAYWLYSRSPRPTVLERLDFLHRVAHWQYRLDELAKAWEFVQRIKETKCD